MKALSAKSPKTGRPKNPTYAMTQADPRLARVRREIQKEFGGSQSQHT